MSRGNRTRRAAGAAEDREAASQLAIIGAVPRLSEVLPSGRLAIVTHELTAIRLTPATMQAILAALDEAAEQRRYLAAEHGCVSRASCEECTSRLAGADDFDYAAGVLRRETTPGE